LPYEDEEKQINPCLFGKRLAEFLRDELGICGIDAQEPIAEDWGWWVPVKDGGRNLRIACGRYEEYPDGFLCFIESRASIFGFFKKSGADESIARLQRALDDVLTEEAGVRQKRWWTEDEFDRKKT
jgi:hypothetical protein